MRGLKIWTQNIATLEKKDAKSLLFFNWTIPGLIFFYFRLFKQTLLLLKEINVKNVHPVYGAGIQTHDLWNMSPLSQPLDQGSCSGSEKSFKGFVASVPEMNNDCWLACMRLSVPRSCLLLEIHDA